MYTGPVYRPVYPYMHIPCIQALSGYGQDRPYTGLHIHSRPMLSGLYIQVLSGYGQYLIYGPTPCMCIHRVQACIPYAYTGLYTRAYRLCIRACIHRVYAMQAAPWISGYGQDRPYTGLQSLESKPGSGPVHTGPGQACSPLDIPMGYG